MIKKKKAVKTKYKYQVGEQVRFTGVAISKDEDTVKIVRKGSVGKIIDRELWQSILFTVPVYHIQLLHSDTVLYFVHDKVFGRKVFERVSEGTKSPTESASHTTGAKSFGLGRSKSPRITPKTPRLRR